MQIPERVLWAVDRLDLRPPDDILEIGCGPGVAVALFAGRLDTGTVTAIDRSATAIARASQRNRAAVDRGTVSFHTMSLEDADFADATFDVAFAINVNLFWVGSAHAEVDRLVRLLRPGGRLHLVWEPPGAGKAEQIADKVSTLLSGRGLAPSVARARTSTGGALVDVHAMTDST